MTAAPVTVRTPAATSWSPPAAARGRDDGRRWRSRRCRSTTGSAAPPALPAPPRSRPRARSGSRPHDDGALRRQRDARAALGLRRPSRTRSNCGSARSATVHYKVDQSSRARPSPAQAGLQRHAADGRRLFRQDQVLLLHRADAAAGRDARDAGGVLRRSRRSPRTATSDDLNTITLSYTFYPPARAASRWRIPPQAGSGPRQDSERRLSNGRRATPNRTTTTTWSTRARGRRSAPSPPSSLAVGAHHLDAPHVAAAPLVFGARRRRRRSTP